MVRLCFSDDTLPFHFNKSRRVRLAELLTRHILECDGEEVPPLLPAAPNCAVFQWLVPALAVCGRVGDNHLQKWVWGPPGMLEVVFGRAVAIVTTWYMFCSCFFRLGAALPYKESLRWNHSAAVSSPPWCHTNISRSVSWNCEVLVANNGKLFCMQASRETWQREDCHYCSLWFSSYPSFLVTSTLLFGKHTCKLHDQVEVESFTTIGLGFVWSWCFFQLHTWGLLWKSS